MLGRGALFLGPLQPPSIYLEYGVGCSAEVVVLIVLVVVGKTALSRERVLKFRHVHVSGVRNIYINIFFEFEDVLGVRFHAGENDNKMILCEIYITCNNAWEHMHKKKEGMGGYHSVHTVQ